MGQDQRQGKPINLSEARETIVTVPCGDVIRIRLVRRKGRAELRIVLPDGSALRHERLPKRELA